MGAHQTVPPCNIAALLLLRVGGTVTEIRTNTWVLKRHVAANRRPSWLLPDQSRAAFSFRKIRLRYSVPPTGELDWELSCGMSCMRRDKRVIVEREGEAKKSHHLPKGASSSQGFKRIQADNASINVFLGEELKPSSCAQHRPHRNVKL